MFSQGLHKDKSSQQFTIWHSSCHSLFIPTNYQEWGFVGICNSEVWNFFFASVPVNPSDVWHTRKWGIENSRKFAKSNKTPPWTIFPLLMVCRLEREYVINEWDYTQPSLTGLWFNTAQFSCAIQSIFHSFFSLCFFISLSSLASVCSCRVFSSITYIPAPVCVILNVFWCRYQAQKDGAVKGTPAWGDTHKFPPPETCRKWTLSTLTLMLIG